MTRFTALLFWSTSVVGGVGPGFGQVLYEQAPIRYSQAAVEDPVARLQKKIDAGVIRLSFDDRRGYLPSVLRVLDVPVSSQVLVFSKTSFQQKRIAAQRPRAIYFSDDVYVGWVQNGDVIEVASIDPRQGAIFYTIQQQEASQPRFDRHIHECLQCHASSLTGGNPGLIVRSVYPDSTGFPILSAGSFLTGPASPLPQRWGGWYVTGTHGRMRHMGNVVAGSKSHPDRLDVEAGANVTNLAGRVDTDPYLSPHSDIVALMVLEHQTSMHNRIISTNYAARIALHGAAIINQMLERPADFLSPSVQRRMKKEAGHLVKDLLCVGQVRLTDPIVGTSAFADQFARRGPQDRQGRSLRQLDLTHQLLKYPCSYLIYSDAMDSLPAPVKEFVYQQLWNVLTGADDSDEFAHLSASDRRAIIEILRDTKTGLPDYWKSPPNSPDGQGTP